MTNSLLPHYILTTISHPQGRGNASLLLDHTNKEIILEEIEVESQYRGMKIGSRLLSQVCWLADSLNFTVVLVPVCLEAPMSLEQLEFWYERYGFRLRDEYSDGYPYAREPKRNSKLIFVYSWRSAQQRTMIILADSREEADRIFFEECAESPDHFVPTHYVTQLFVDGGESTIIYNN